MDEESVGETIADILSANPPPEMEGMPVLIEWILVAAFDDASDPSGGQVVTLSPAHQWRHRSEGLLEAGRASLIPDDDD